MNNDNYLKTSPAVIVILIVLQATIIFISALFRLQHWAGANSLMLLGLALGIVQLPILLGDVISNKIRRKGMWIIILILGGTIATIIYLVLRKDLLKASQAPE